MGKNSILIVDDEPMIIADVSKSLRDAGYHTIESLDGIDALSRIGQESIDLILLDMMMPKIDGFEVCRRIREWSQIPIIMLSSLDDEELKANILMLGADDYIVKPFGVKEMRARIEAVLRRVHRNGTVIDKPNFIYGDLTIDFQFRRVTMKDKEIELTATEFGVLREFVLNQGQLLTHRTLLHRVWGPEYGDEKEYVRVIVNRLRKKLGDDPIDPKYLKTVPGVGYRFLSQEPLELDWSLESQPSKQWSNAQLIPAAA